MTDWTTATYAEAGFIVGTALFLVGLAAFSVTKWWRKTRRR